MSAAKSALNILNPHISTIDGDVYPPQQVDTIRVGPPVQFFTSLEPNSIMSNLIRPLTNADIERIRPLLNQYPVANLYLRDLIDRQGIDYFGLHRWMGAFENDILVALNADIAAVNPKVPCKLECSRW